MRLPESESLMPARRCLPYLLTILLSGGAILMVTTDLGFIVEDTDLFGVLWGMVIPALAPLVFW